MTNENYIVIQGWMINNLELKGNELILFALIYGFHQKQDGHGFHGSLKYMEKAIRSSRNTVKKAIRGLEDKGLIRVEDEYKNGVQFKRYFIIDGGGQFLTPGGQLLREGGSISDPNNTIDNNKDNSNNKSDSPKKSIQKKEKDGELFDNPGRSRLMKNGPAADFDWVAGHFSGPEFDGINLGHYHGAIMDWSTSANKKRTPDGWVATIRNAIRKDVSANKVVRIGNGNNDVNLMKASQQIWDNV